ncbi:MAG: class I SAM-dependent methyltransferase [Planctomycetota bacterium]|jgi:SAM-dependent methyltransferase
MQTKELDMAKAEAFAEKMLQIMNSGALALMTSIGHRTGLFDTMRNLPPATSGQIAEAANLNERYVREWLGAMVTGGLVDYDPGHGFYTLPPEHASFLTREASPDNVAVVAQFIPILGNVEDQIIACFHQGGGLHYSSYDRFHEVMAEESGQTVVSALMDGILPLAPGLIDALEDGIEVLDVGCGSGRALNLMAMHFPKSSFVGYDLCGETIERSRAEAIQRDLDNVYFEMVDMTRFDEKNVYDLITAFDAIHDQAHPDKVLKRIHQALRPGGIFLMQDIAASSQLEKNVDHPVGSLLYTISCMHCMSVSLAQDGVGLGAVWGQEKALELLGEAGFNDVEVKTLPHDIMNNYYIARKR